tara:strand:- start:619 stop:834 length:216 start_codon:yes stop_codon:yes gene_type:complete
LTAAHFLQNGLLLTVLNPFGNAAQSQITCQLNDGMGNSCVFIVNNNFINKGFVDFNCVDEKVFRYGLFIWP